jgi:hypothetical protein
MAQTGNKIIELSKQSINKHTYFRDQINIPGNVLKRINDKGRGYGFEYIKPFKVENFELAEWVGLTLNSRKPGQLFPNIQLPSS